MLFFFFFFIYKQDPKFVLNVEILSPKILPHLDLWECYSPTRFMVLCPWLHFACIITKEAKTEMNKSYAHAIF